MPEQEQLQGDPKPSRPVIPGYGVPESDEGMLPWSHVTERMEQARNYWVGTVGKDGRPHAVPVWGLWVDGAFYFGAGPRTVRNLTANPEVVVHLESADDVVILEGRAEVLANPDPALWERVAGVSEAKYGYKSETPGGYVLRPRVVYAWSKFPSDATRWRFEE